MTLFQKILLPSKVGLPEHGATNCLQNADFCKPNCTGAYPELSARHSAPWDCLLDQGNRHSCRNGVAWKNKHGGNFAKYLSESLLCFARDKFCIAACQNFPSHVAMNLAVWLQTACHLVQQTHTHTQDRVRFVPGCVRVWQVRDWKLAGVGNAVLTVAYKVTFLKRCSDCDFKKTLSKWDL